jgi:hypothetical protein
MDPLAHRLKKNAHGKPQQAFLGLTLRTVVFLLSPNDARTIRSEKGSFFSAVCRNLDPTMSWLSDF